ncbi:MAG: formylglycine-generating enzyme family protein [Gammaproteobacteria bacterium]|nr:formylglycine-generating enzyme family protein [Gammaproteobacteria bacterium]
MSGDTWHFQFWYRDTPAGQGTSNFSGGLSVTFPVTGVVTPIAGMVQIPAGTFSMGSNAASGAPYFGQPSEQPVHSVTISQSFWMGETEVTQTQYQAVMGVNPSYFTGANFPVELVSWNDARAYCTALTAQEQAAGNIPVGMEYRLPTEAEWEYACRAGTTTEFSVGPDLFCGQAKFLYSYHSNSSCGSSSTTGTAAYSPNLFGLYGMHGNVWEWCLDSYLAYSGSSQTDPFVTGGTVRVVRGGSWYYDSTHSRSSFRGYFSPGNSADDVGFRVVLASVLVP